MINVCFAGVTGWTAPPVLAALEQADDLALVAGVSRSAAGRRLSDVAGGVLADNDGLVHGTVAEAVAATRCDVVIDYTSASAVRANAFAAVDAGVHLVIGSSGLTGDDYAELDRRAREQQVGVVAAGNFSVLAAVLRKAAALAAQHLDRWEIIDYAADAKPDVPSGTARELAETLAQVKTPQTTVAIEDLHGPVEARGVEVGGTRIHSVRLPSFLVSTEIVFAADGERLGLRHDAGQSPDPYVAGTLLAVRAVPSRRGLTRGLDALLFAAGSDGTDS